MRIAFDMFIVEQERNEAFFSTQILLDKLAHADQQNEYIVVTGRPREYYMQSMLPCISLYALKTRMWRGMLMQHQLLLPTALQRIKPDIVHVPNSAAPIGWQGKLVIAIHNLAFLDEQYQSSPFHAQLYWHYLLHESMQRAHCIITSTEQIRTELLGRWPIEQTRVHTVANKASATAMLQIYQDVLELGG